MTTALILIITALAAYLLGCFNGSILVSKFVFHEDIREKGSGNAGLTNFFRTYGVKCVGVMLAIDILKTVLAILLGKFVFGHFLQRPELGEYWASFFVVMGHCFPCMFSFRGGKGVLCSGTMLVMLDWRIALVGLGLFALTVLLTGYVSLGSVLAAFSLPFTTFWVYHGSADFPWIMTIGTVLAAFVIWAHRANIKRLVTGKENKLRFSKKENQQ